MNKCIAINLIKDAKYRATHINHDKTKTVTIRVGKVTVAVINETITRDGKVWFVHLNASKARIADNLQMAYAMTLDDFIVAFERQTDNIKVTFAGPMPKGERSYSLYNTQTGMSIEYVQNERCYGFEEVFKPFWQQGFDSLTIKKIQLAIFIFESA